MPEEVVTRFVQRPFPVQSRDRVVWRISALLLVLHHCHRRRASLAHLHALMWGLRSARTRQSFLRRWNGSQLNTGSMFDPGLEVTIRLAAAWGLIQMLTSSKIGLTEAGKEVASLLIETNLLNDEREFLAALGRLTSVALQGHLSGAGANVT